MSIDVKCANCSARFNARDELAGKRVACPKCQAAIHIPDPVAASAAKAAASRSAPPTAIDKALGIGELLDDWDKAHGIAPRPTGNGAAGSCPTCGAALPPQAVLCVHCGFNRQTGKQMTMKRDVARRSEPKPDRRPAPRRRRGAALGNLIPAGPPRIVLIVVGAILGLVLFAVLPLQMLMLSMLIGVCMSIAGNLWLLACAAEEGALQLLLILFVPFYGLVYIVTRWDACKGPVAVSFGGVGVVVLGMVLSLVGAGLFHSNQPAPDWLPGSSPSSRGAVP